MDKTFNHICEGNKIKPVNNILFLKEQSNTNRPTEQEIILEGIQKGLEDRQKKNILTFEESFEILEKLIKESGDFYKCEFF